MEVAVHVEALLDFLDLDQTPDVALRQLVTE
jgi:hypothetical protein